MKYAQFVTILYQKKSYRMLPCTHKFHYNCLKLWEDSLLNKQCAKDCGNKCSNLCKKNCKYHCPFCREEYNKMVLPKKKNDKRRLHL